MPLSPLNQSTLTNIRLIASDVDGTLTHKGKLSSDFISTLLDLQSAGIKVLLVTGHSAGWVSALVNYLPVAGAIAESSSLLGWRQWIVIILMTPFNYSQIPCQPSLFIN